MRFPAQGSQDTCQPRNLSSLTTVSALKGNTIPSASPVLQLVIDIYRAQEPDKFYRETETHGADEQPNVNSDDELGENFVMSDLPVGDYIVRVPGKPFAARVTAEAGKLTFVEMVH
jgi:hypothetical protein